MRLFYSQKTHSLFLILFIISVIFSWDAVFAANGKITGKIVDSETKEPIPGVNVILTHKISDRGEEVELDLLLGAATNLEGEYFILNIPPGNYVIKASIVGYAPVIQKGVLVDSDRTINVDFELALTQIEINEVVVTAKREIIKQDIASTQEIITPARIEQMPITRVDEFIGRLKGVELESSSEGNGIQIRGGSIRETDIRLDGISLQDPRSGSSYLAINSTSIEETQVLTGGFQSKYGGVRAGIINFVTKNGQRSKYTVSLKADMAPKKQERFFGTNLWSDESWLYRVYAGEYAFTGTVGDTTVPEDLRGFKGWARETNANIRALDSLQKRDLWVAQHPQYEFGNKPDVFLEASITGPIPGSFIPLWGDFAKSSTFMLALKYENSQFAYPVGPRDSYEDMNGQLKITTLLQDNIRLSLNGFYSKILTNGGGAASNFGAVIGGASSFTYFNNSYENINYQGRLVNGDNLYNVFNLSRFQYLDKRTIFGGARLIHTLSDRAFYTLDFSVGYADQSLSPFIKDTSIAGNYVSFEGRDGRTYRYDLPQYGSPNAATNFIADAMNQFRMSGGTQRVDSSYSVSYQLKGDLTYQLDKHNQIETGFSLKLDDIFVYSGTWLQDQLSYTPDTWEYYKETPLEIGVYAQDKLEFEGMILTAGLRLDMLDPMKKSFSVQFPLDTSYQYLYNTIYQRLQGSDYERWKQIRDFLDDPGSVWPTTENEIQLYLSPRLGVSFPVTEDSKLYFNYGHFYQKQPLQFLYKPYISPNTAVVPTPGLPYLKTVQYEFGYEQLLFSEILVNATAYYKDQSNDVLTQTYYNYYGDNNVIQYVPQKYNDVRGVELRIEKPVGRFVSFNAMYDYMIITAGQTGYASLYEDAVKQYENQLRYPRINTPEPRPRGNITLNLHTPNDFGPEFAGVNWFGSWYANIFFEWRDGGRYLLNPEETLVRFQQYVDVVDYWNIDLRLSKTFPTSYGDIELILTVQNLTNNKWLNTANMSISQLNNYKNSLKTPDKNGDDKWGEYDKDYIDTGWNTFSIFTNPRRIILGLRINI